MQFRFTIGRRIGMGFTIFILLTVIAFIMTIITLNGSKRQTETVVGQVTPSIVALKEMNLLLQRAHTDISKWVYNNSFNDIEFRDDINNIIKKEYPQKKTLLQNLSKLWSDKELKQLNEIFTLSTELFTYQTQIINQLNNSKAYEDGGIKFEVLSNYEESESIINKIYKDLNVLISEKQLFAENLKIKMFNSLDFLKTFVQFLGLALVIGGILIAIFTTRSITIPIQILKKMLLSMGIGVLPAERIDATKDEIGEMGKALNDLINSMDQTTIFANETGSGNFEATYTPLSKDDALGHALLKMRVSLAENEHDLEQKVIERTEEVTRQKSVIENKNEELSELYKQVTDSIHYAKRIQYSLLASEKLLKENLKNYFLFFKPKDVVSGDFYWGIKNINSKGVENFLLVTADSTGHGVPGSIMSILNISCLNESITSDKFVEPADILNATRKKIIRQLSNDGSLTGGKDGMDCSIIALELKNKMLVYSAANNPIWIVRDKTLIALAADRMPVGKHDKDHVLFNQHEFKLKDGDLVYTLTDGFPDQFGGPKGKKFKYKQLQELLISISNETMEIQNQLLNEVFESWKGDLEQVDDVLIIGVKI